MQEYWFGTVDGDRFEPAESDSDSRADRVQHLGINIRTYTPLPLEAAIACGGFSSQKEYLRDLREVSFALAEEKIVALFERGDLELIQMVRLLDEMDTVVNLLTERATEWYAIKNPGFSRKYRSLKGGKMVSLLKRDRGSRLGPIGSTIESLAQERTALMKTISWRADAVLPNSSALVGGLVAARLLARTGSLEGLARLPSSTLQVMGAESALFSHIRSGAPSPKHGIIFQHRRVHNAPRVVRGRVARVLAGKMAIAAKMDCYRGEIDAAFIEHAQQAIDRAGEVPQ